VCHVWDNLICPLEPLVDVVRKSFFSGVGVQLNAFLFLQSDLSQRGFIIFLFVALGEEDITLDIPV